MSGTGAGRARQYVAGRFAVQDFPATYIQPATVQTVQAVPAVPAMVIAVPAQPPPQPMSTAPDRAVIEGLDKIKAGNVQHQKMLRDLIIFHRPGEDVIDDDSVLDRLVCVSVCCLVLRLCASACCVVCAFACSSTKGRRGR